MKALIFDVDGTLAETEDLHRLAFNRTFQEAGLDWHWSVATYTQLLKTTGGKERMRAWGDFTGEDISDDKIGELHRTKTDHYGALLAGGAFALRPGVSDLISHAKKQGIRLAVATTTNRPNVDALCQSCFGKPAEDIFEVIAAGDEVREKKPAPDVYLLALDRLRLSPRDAIALEDSRNGVLSAKAAGLQVIATPSVYTAADRLDEADKIVSDLSVDAVEGLLACCG